MITQEVQIKMHSSWDGEWKWYNMALSGFSFLIAGHTKFDVDRMFSLTAKAYNASDVFDTQELLQVMCQTLEL